ncbi:MAG: hypothetical protein ACE5LV_00275 [Candidatus Aminicenantales bacterium]
MSSRPGGTVDFKRSLPAHDPGSQDKVSKPHRVVRVEVDGS